MNDESVVVFVDVVVVVGGGGGVVVVVGGGEARGASDWSENIERCYLRLSRSRTHRGAGASRRARSDVERGQDLVENPRHSGVLQLGRNNFASGGGGGSGVARACARESEHD